MTTYRKTRVPPTEHTHGSWERRMSWEKMAEHLVEDHGWTEGMIAQRGRVDGGEYLYVTHDNEHNTQHLDPEGTWTAPKESK